MVAIGNGTVQQLQKFEGEYELCFQLYTNPTLDCFQAFNMKKKFGIGPRAILRYLKVLAKGYRQGWTHGDPWQQGGVVILDGRLNQIWCHVNDGPGDHADLEMIINQLAQHGQQET